MRQTLRLVGPDAAPQWRLMAGGTVVLLAEVAFRVMEPWPLKVVIDSLVASMGRHTGSAPATTSSLVGLGVALLVIVAGRAGCNYLATVAFALVGSRTAASLRSRKSEGNLANTAQEALGAIKVVQAYGLEPLLHKRFTGANTVSLSEGVRSRRIAARLERSTDVIVGVATAVVMVGGGIRVLNGAMSPGDLVLFTTYLRTTMKPLRDMAKYTGRIARATASGERVADLMAVEPEIVSPHNAVVLDRVHGMVHFDHVHAAYEGRRVLHGVSLTVVSGEHVALVGPSGSGKSTLVSLVVRALDPTSGTVSLDGYSLGDLDLRFLRSQVSVLHQEAVLLTGTIRENIRLGRPDATDEEVEAAAHAAHAHDFITQMPDGYDTPVGERGGTLSGGQRQRIAIARALLRDSPIIILDEATTGLDPASTSAVLEAIDELVTGRTTLTVTHDPQAAMRADRVVWIQDGRILLEGSPQRLLDTSAEFRRWANSHLSSSFALEGSGS